MKNIILIFIVTAIWSPIFIHAQTQAPNANFEDWTILENGAENPTGWGSSNFAVHLGVPQSIFKTTDAAFGDFALKVVTPALGTTIYTTQAELNEGPFDDGGLPYTDRPLNMAAWIKGTIYPGDTAFVRAWLTRWNSDTQTTEFIANAYIGLAAIDTVYALRLEAFDYVSNAQPDTLFLVAGFGDHSEVTINSDNQFFVDNIVFSGLATSTNHPSRLGKLRLFPNPTDEKIHLKIDFENRVDVTLTIFNERGQVVSQLREEQILNLDKVIDLANRAEGIYFIRLMADGKSLLTEKIMLLKN